MSVGLLGKCLLAPEKEMLDGLALSDGDTGNLVAQDKATPRMPGPRWAELRGW